MELFLVVFLSGEQTGNCYFPSRKIRNWMSENVCAERLSGVVSAQWRSRVDSLVIKLRREKLRRETLRRENKQEIVIFYLIPEN